MLRKKIGCLGKRVGGHEDLVDAVDKPDEKFVVFNGEVAGTPMLADDVRPDQSDDEQHKQVGVDVEAGGHHAARRSARSGSRDA